MTETWLPWCIKRPGPEWKRGYGGIKAIPLDQKEGEVKHSAEGSLAALFSELGRSDRTASWTFSLSRAGPVYQHYSLESMTWHAGLPGDRRTDTSLIGNMTLIGEEHEGGGPGNPGQRLTEAQYQASLRLSWDIRALCPRVGARPPTLRVNLWEHNWLSWTSCPSGRIPWARLIADLEGDDMATAAEVRSTARALQRMLTTGRVTSGLIGPGGDRDELGGWPDQHEAGVTLQAILDAINRIPASSGGGLTEAQVEAVITRVLKRQKLIVQ